LIIALSNISFNHIGFNKKLNRETIIFTSFFASYIILPYVLNNTLTYQELITQKFAWNLISAIYPSIRVSFLEEILFRGMIQTYFCLKLSRIKDGHFIAILTSSLIFAFCHYPLQVGIGYGTGEKIDGAFASHFIRGCIYGWLYYRTQNIWSPIFLHGLNNFIFYLLK
jgi:membrane protease YdiL (CAAX protease family)